MYNENDVNFVKRKGARGFVYYFVYEDERNPGVLIRRSTKCRKISDARKVVNTYFKTGLIITPGEKYEDVKKKQEEKKSSSAFLTFSDLVEQKHYWDFEKCPYIRTRVARGNEKHPGFRKDTAYHYDLITKNHLLPFFGKMKVKDIKPEDIEAFMVEEKKNGVSNSTINSYRKVLNLILKEALRNEVIFSNPVERTLPGRIEEYKRDLLTPEEVKKLFSEDVWKDEGELYYTITYTSYNTGMREGELLALQKGDVFPTYISVTKDYLIGYGLNRPKNGEDRKVPITESVREALLSLENERRDGEFLFSHDGKIPMAPSKVREHFYSALSKIGIEKDERKRRHLTFHSLRSSFITNSLILGVPKEKVAKIVGHKKLEMTDHYTNFSDDEVISSYLELISSKLKGRH